MSPQPAPEPATPQTPSTEADDDRLVEPPDPAIWQDVVGRCPNCGTIIKGRLAIEREAADRAAGLLDVERVLDIVMGEPAWPRAGAIRRRRVVEAIRALAADRAAPADRIDVEALAIAIQVVQLRTASNYGEAERIAAEYDRLRGSR